MARVSNSDARYMVERREKFKTNNQTMFGEWSSSAGLDGGRSYRYAVFSYGYHFPMYVYDEQAGVWIGNKDKYSRTTTTHQNKARPNQPIDQWYDTHTCKLIYHNGLATIVANRME